MTDKSYETVELQFHTIQFLSKLSELSMVAMVWFNCLGGV